jgi:Transcriptional regulator, AbiEi antitoxin
MSCEVPSACRDLVELQRGVISRRQALHAGMGPDDIGRLLRSGRWQCLQRGAYAVFTGEAPREAVLWAMVHRAGPGATLSHQTAAELFGLTDGPSSLIHVTIPAVRRVGTIPGAVIHRSGRLELARHPTLLPPRTRIEETVLDLVEQAETFERAFDWVCRACQQRITTAGRVSGSLGMRKKARWRPELSEALDDIGEGIHSLLEYRYIHHVERPHGLPSGTRQARIVRGARSYYLDNLYADYHVCAELDGRIAHPDEQRWQDGRRDNAAAAEGLVTLRFNWADVTRQPCQAASQLAAALQRGGWSGVPRRCGVSCPIP